MHTTDELLDLLKDRLAERFALEKPVSDYRACKVLKIPPATFYGWREPDRGIGLEYVGVIADATGLHPEYVYACVECERAKRPEIRAILRRIGSRYAPDAASNLLAAS